MTLRAFITKERRARQVDGSRRSHGPPLADGYKCQEVSWQKISESFITSSYINCKVRADLPTPPLPTIITLWTTACDGGFLAAIFCCPADAMPAPAASVEVGRGWVLRRPLNFLGTDVCSWLRQCWNHSELGVLDLAVESLAATAADGQANVKILERFGSCGSSGWWSLLLRWMVWTQNIRTEPGHWDTDLRIESQLSRTLTRISSRAESVLANNKPTTRLTLWQVDSTKSAAKLMTAVDVPVLFPVCH